MQEPWAGGGTRFYRARGGNVNGSTCLGEEAGGKVPRRYGPIRPSSIPVLRAEIGQHLFDSSGPHDEPEKRSVACGV
jgi:hypothetical protein